MSELNSMYKRAEWAAKLILNPDSEVSIDFESADKVLVYHMDGRTSIAQTRTNEPLLLQALIKEICRKIKIGEITNKRKEEQ